MGLVSKIKNTFRKQCLISMRMAQKVAGRCERRKPTYDKYILPHHVAVPMPKSNNEYVFNKQRDEIIDACSKKRNRKNVNQYVYTDAAYFRGLTIDSMPTNSYIEYSSGKSMKFVHKTILSNKNKLFYINDTSSVTDEFRTEVTKTLSERFPQKCKYEL